MSEYGEPWWYNCTSGDEGNAEPGDVSDVFLYEQGQPDPEPFAHACSCCDGINISERHLKRMILCINACAGVSDKDVLTRTAAW